MKKSRILYLHPEANPGKLVALEAVHAEYRRYLQVCIDAMISTRVFSVGLKEISRFFPPEKVLSYNIVTACQRQANSIVGTWCITSYTRMKSKIKALFKDVEIDETRRKQLYTIGKYGVNRPSNTISQEAIDQYWVLLLDSFRPPTASPRIGMRTTVHTADLIRNNNDLTGWWLRFSNLAKGKKICAPLSGNPFIKSKESITQGALVRKDRKGRWLISVLESEDYPEPKLDLDSPKVGVDVGLNVLAATSDGRLYGADVKPKFDSLYSKVKTLRANRQRQGLKLNSPKLDRLEDRLSGLIKTAVGTVANKLVKDYPDHAFVVEDLDLSGCKGSKRFAYRALHRSLATKAPIIVVNPAYTSQTCPSCGYVSRANRSGVKFHCRSCGRKSHADVVGALNILGRSRDQSIGCDDDPSEVKSFLNKRYRKRRNPSRDSSLGVGKNELATSNQRLTTKGSRLRDIGIAPNALEQSHGSYSK